MKVHEGALTAKNMKVALIASRFNDLITKELIGGADDCLRRHGAAADDIHVYWVPGAFEIPKVALEVAKTGKYDGVICVGAVIRGSTPHFDMVAAEVSKGVARLTMEVETPVIFGVLTTDSIEQALERAGTKAGNKGWDAAISMMEMVNLTSEIRDAK